MKFYLPYKENLTSKTFKTTYRVSSFINKGFPLLIYIPQVIPAPHTNQTRQIVMDSSVSTKIFTG